jgi:hypothetical protein
MSSQFVQFFGPFRRNSSDVTIAKLNKTHLDNYSTMLSKSARRDRTLVRQAKVNRLRSELARLESCRWTMEDMVTPIILAYIARINELELYIRLDSDDELGLFSVLPHTVTVHILHLLNVADKVRLMATCKTLYEMRDKAEIYGLQEIDHVPPRPPSAIEIVGRCQLLADKNLPHERQIALLYSIARYFGKSLQWCITCVMYEKPDDGPGNFIYYADTTRRKYFGEIVSCNKSGFGIDCDPRGSAYIGQHLGGQKHGKGELITRDWRFSGEFFCGSKCGEGVMRMYARKITAWYHAGSPAGPAVVKMAPKYKYVGMVGATGEANVYGEFKRTTDKCKVVYRGETSFGAPHGNGLYICYVRADKWKILYTFRGKFKRGKPKFGLVHTSRDKYSGEFSAKDGLRDGHGTLEDGRGIRNVSYSRGKKIFDMYCDELESSPAICEVELSTVGMVGYEPHDDDESHDLETVELARKDKKRKLE